MEQNTNIDRQRKIKLSHTTHFTLQMYVQYPTNRWLSARLQ